MAGVTGCAALGTFLEGSGTGRDCRCSFCWVTARSSPGGIVDCFFGFNVAYVSRDSAGGQLDHTLIMPQPVWVSFLTEGFLPISGSAILAPGVGLLAWSTHRLHLALSPGWVALLALNLAASVLILLAFQYGWGSLAFWAPRAAEEMSPPRCG